MSHTRESIAKHLNSVGIHNESLITTILAYSGMSVGVSWGKTGAGIVFSWDDHLPYYVTLWCQQNDGEILYMLDTNDSSIQTTDGININKLLNEKLKIYLFWSKFN